MALIRVFDLDGVLVDTPAYVSSFLDYLLVREGSLYKKTSRDVIKEHFKLGNLPAFYQQMGVAMPFEEIGSLHRQFFAQNIPEIFPDLKEYLASSMSPSSMNVVYSDNRQENVSTILNYNGVVGYVRMHDGLGALFGSKNWKDLADRLEPHLDRDNQFIFIGDQTGDSRVCKDFARGTGFSCLNVLTSYGLGRKEDLVGENPDYIADSAQQLSDFLSYQDSLRGI